MIAMSWFYRGSMYLSFGWTFAFYMPMLSVVRDWATEKAIYKNLHSLLSTVKKILLPHCFHHYISTDKYLHFYGSKCTESFLGQSCVRWYFVVGGSLGSCHWKSLTTSTSSSNYWYVGPHSKTQGASWYVTLCQHKSNSFERIWSDANLLSYVCMSSVVLSGTLGIATYRSLLSCSDRHCSWYTTFILSSMRRYLSTLLLEPNYSAVETSHRTKIKVGRFKTWDEAGQFNKALRDKERR